MLPRLCSRTMLALVIALRRGAHVAVNVCAPVHVCRRIAAFTRAEILTSSCGDRVYADHVKRTGNFNKS